MSKIILQKGEAKQKLLNGVNLVADVVRSTIGPCGRNAIFSDPYGLPVVTNDGVSIAKEVTSDDVTEQLGIDVIKQSSLRTNFLAGDGTTTSIVLAQAIVKEGMNSSINPIELRNIINKDCENIIKELEKDVKKINSFDEIKQIATISAENEEIGELIATATHKVGNDGQVNVQESEIQGVSVEYTNGFEIPEGYIHPYMMNTEKAEAELPNPLIAIIDTEINNIKDILPIIEKVVEKGHKSLVVICDGMKGNMIPTIVKNKMEGKFEIIGIKLPYTNKQEFLDDISIVTGGKIMGISTGLFPNKANIDDLGTCDKIVARAKTTTIIGGKGDVSKKVEELKVQKENSEINKDKYDARVARLLGQVALIKVGAPTDAEVRYMKLKIDDAVCATKAAIEEGIIRGGGVPLKTLANTMEMSDVMKKAIQAPYNQIQENAGGKLVIEDHVYDPFKVTRIALANAVSAAGILLTTDSTIATVIEK